MLENRGFDRLCPDVVAEGAFSACLQGRAVGTIGALVVLPGHIVLALGKQATVDEGVDGSGSAGTKGIVGAAVGGYGCREYEQVVVGELIGHFIAFGIDNHEALACGKVQ